MLYVLSDVYAYVLYVMYMCMYVYICLHVCHVRMCYKNICMHVCLYADVIFVKEHTINLTLLHVCTYHTLSQHRFDPKESRWKRNKAGNIVAVDYKSSDSGCG